MSQFGVAKRENKKQREKVIDTGVIKSQTHIDAHLVGEKKNRVLREIDKREDFMKTEWSRI